MPNQMIALQSRGAQLPDPSAQTAKFVNMMNMTKQQEAAERQAAQAAQAMEFARSGEARAAQTQTSAMRKADSDFQESEMKRLAKIGVAILETEDPAIREAAYQNLLGLVEETDPQLGATMRQVAGTFNAPVLQSVVMEVENYFNKKYPTPTTETIFGPNNEVLEATRGGLPGVAGVRPLLNMPARGAPAATPTPTPTAGAAMRATQGANTTPQDLIDQGMNPNNIPSGMPTSPASFTRGGNAGRMSPDMVPAILDAAVNTGVMAQIDLDQMLALAPPQARDGIMNVIRSNNISLQADAPSLAASGMGQQPMAANPVQTPQSQFAVNRGAPMATTLAQTNVMGQQAYGRSASPTSPLPGSSQVPLSRVRAEGVAGRSSPAEEAAKARATKQVELEMAPRIAAANATAEANKKAAEKLPGRNQVSTLIKKVRAAYEQLDKAKAIPSEKRGGFENAMDYFGSSSLGREAQKMVGTKSSKYLSEIINSRKLLATAIKNATGMSAQEMNSNVELQLTLDALTDPTQGIEAARTTLDTLEELYGAPRTAAGAPRAATKTPVIPTLTPEQVRANPNIKRWKRADNGQIMVRK